MCVKDYEIRYDIFDKNQPDQTIFFWVRRVLAESLKVTGFLNTMVAFR